MKRLTITLTLTATFFCALDATAGWTDRTITNNTNQSVNLSGAYVQISGNCTRGGGGAVVSHYINGPLYIVKGVAPVQDLGCGATCPKELEAKASCKFTLSHCYGFTQSRGTAGPSCPIVPASDYGPPQLTSNLFPVGVTIT